MALVLLVEAPMMALLLIVGFVAAGMIIGLVAATKAPVGYEDETGFHYGPEHGQAKENVHCGVPQPQRA